VYASAPDAIATIYDATTPPSDATETTSDFAAPPLDATVTTFGCAAPPLGALALGPAVVLPIFLYNFLNIIILG
jgi:hypothetical protein